MPRLSRQRTGQTCEVDTQPAIVAILRALASATAVTLFRHIECYIVTRLEQGITLCTLHNYMAAVRVMLRTAGRNKLADSERLSNKALGLGGASWDGTRRTITPECYQAALAILQQRDDGLALTLQLARMMGLRSQEAVQCSQSTWGAALDRGDERLTVVFGTKGGRRGKRWF